MLGEKDKDVVTLNQLYKVNLPRYIVAEQELVIVIKAVNEQWVADYDNDCQNKWYNWWYLGKDFRLSDSYYGDSHSFVSSRLVLESEEKAKFLAKQFKNLYEQYMNK